MKVLVYGSKGWIGTMFCDLLKKEGIEFICGTVHVDNDVAFQNEIDEYQPTHLVSFIGRTHGIYEGETIGTIDYLEKPGKLVENVRDNLYSPLLMAIESQKRNIHFTYLGTGCIFEYDENHPFGKEENGFTEDSLPNFFGSSYSIVKGYTDRLMKHFHKNVLNLRIRMPITADRNPRNFITKITQYEKVCSIPNSMSVLPELLPYVIDMMKNHVKGTMNLTNPGLISHNEILEMYKEIIDPSFTWKNFNIDEQNQILSSKRSNNYLETAKLQYFYPEVKNIHQSVREMLEQMKKN